IKMGVLVNYPSGVPDVFEYVIIEDGRKLEWKTMEIEGSWFPHAFIGSMAEVMTAAEGSISSPDNSVEDCIYTMACVEAAYESSKPGAVKLNKITDAARDSVRNELDINQNNSRV